MTFDNIEFNNPDLSCIDLPGRRILYQTQDGDYRICSSAQYNTYSKRSIIKWADCPPYCLTNREMLIVSLIPLFPSENLEFLDNVITDVYNYDYACFCSSMSDYDRPSEREDAYKEWSDKLHSKYQDKDSVVRIFNILLKEDNKYRAFYKKHFHEMNKVYEG